MIPIESTSDLFDYYVMVLLDYRKADSLASGTCERYSFDISFDKSLLVLAS